MPGYFLMRRDLTTPIASVPLPEAIVLAHFSIDIAPDCRSVMDAAYAPAGYATVPFEPWYAALAGNSEFDSALVWVAMSGCAVVGFCQCWRTPFVKDLVVAAAWRNRGLGSALLSQALQAFAARSAVSVDLKTDIDNIKAQSLYRRLGFQIVERIAD
ncbi:MAG: GNAT family N-acetyltransferase [Devosia sp.]